MAKNKTVYVCENCGQESPKWIGRCPSCGEWNTFKELHVAPAQPAGRQSTPAWHPATPGNTEKSRPVALTNIETGREQRFDTHDHELNRVLGGGIVPGSLILLGGEPGIGKSTLLLQTVLRMADRRILYISGEESERQIKLRADRIAPAEDTGHCLLLCDTELNNVFTHVADVAPDLVIIDSIQTMSLSEVDSAPGSVTQIRACASALLQFAKQSGIPVIIIGHITKEGTLAGPKVLEHIVDAVLQFEGDRHYLYRILRCIKNRFGSTAELGIYEMTGDGLRAVENPSEQLLGEGNEGMSGVAIAAAVEGVRPFLIETQALVSTAAYGVPQRSATGFDLRRLNMLLAVLEKRVGFKLAQKDVFLNIAGGIRVTDPAIDLSVISAVLSSNVDTGIEPLTCMAGEVGLSGEIRPVTRITQRVSEAARLGFRRIIIPAFNSKSLDASKYAIEIIPAVRVEDALRHLFG